MKREAFAQVMVRWIEKEQALFHRQFHTSGQIPSFVVDDLLPEDLAHTLARRFPKPETLTLRNTFRERKYVTSQMDRCDPEIEEMTFAFLQPELLRLIEKITGFPELLPDAGLYAAGVSSMPQGCFLKPHLDNSHDLSGKKYRMLNLLYYISEGWKLENGGNLELWEQGPGKPQRTVCSQFNRLVVMYTGGQSWHSVSEVRCQAPRQCISTYYFASQPMDGKGGYHVTSFKARPEDGWRKWLFEADLLVRNAIRKTVHTVTRGNIGTFHLYKKDEKKT